MFLEEATACRQVSLSSQSHPTQGSMQRPRALVFQGSCGLHCPAGQLPSCSPHITHYALPCLCRRRRGISYAALLSLHHSNSCRAATKRTNWRKKSGFMLGTQNLGGAGGGDCERRVGELKWQTPSIAALGAFQNNLVVSLLFQSCNLLPQKGKQNYAPSTGNSVVWHHGDTPVSHHLSCCHWVLHRPLWPLEVGEEHKQTSSTSSANPTQGGSALPTDLRRKGGVRTVGSTQCPTGGYALMVLSFSTHPL